MITASVVVVILSAAFYMIWRRGKKAAEAKAIEKRLEALRKATEIDAEIDQMGDDERLRELGRFVRDRKR